MKPSLYPFPARSQGSPVAETAVVSFQRELGRTVMLWSSGIFVGLRIPGRSQQVLHLGSFVRQFGAGPGAMVGGWRFRLAPRCQKASRTPPGPGSRLDGEDRGSPGNEEDVAVPLGDSRLRS